MLHLIRNILSKLWNHKYYRQYKEKICNQLKSFYANAFITKLIFLQADTV